MTAPDDEEKNLDHVYDVVIIGGGYSGLSAGLYFKDCNVNNFIILEARNRVGGRVCTETVTLDDGSSCYVDAGGAYIGPTQNRLLRICNRFGIKTFHVNMKGKSILEYNNRLSAYIGTVPRNIGIFTLFDLNHIINETNNLAELINTVDIHKSSLNSKLLHKYDNITVEQWILSQIENTEAKSQYRDAIRAILCVDPSEISMLYWLNYVKNANSVMHLVETKNGAQDSKIVGGCQNICDSMKKYIDLNQKRIKLKHIVRCIEYNKNYIKIYCNNNTSFKSKYLLCCIPPSLYNTIQWKPKLSWKRSQISSRMPMGFILKTNTYFKTAFWRKDGYNGLSFCCGDNNDNDKHLSPVVITFDDCKPDGSYPSLMGFILSDKARKYNEMSYEERKQCVLKQYKRIFKSDKAITECIGYFEKIWHDEEYSGGCYVGTTGCNVMSKEYWKVLKQSENNNIYFASTELADYWMGYMDGAIQAAEREANKITTILSNNNKDIKIKKIWPPDEEPQLDQCPLPYVDIGPTWYEKRLIPTSSQTRYCIFFLILIIVLLYYYT